MLGKLIGAACLTAVLCSPVAAQQAGTGSGRIDPRSVADWLPRVVAVASIGHGMIPGIDFAGFRKPVPGSVSETNVLTRYQEGKAANVLFASGLAEKGKGKLRAYSLHPGGTSPAAHAILFG